jgi:hypothetical protein
MLHRPKKGDSYYENTRWCNRDLIPMPPERRTWGIWGYFGMHLEVADTKHIGLDNGRLLDRVWVLHICLVNW